MKKYITVVEYLQRMPDSIRFEKVSRLPSETVPEQALTLRQIVSRFKQGVPVPTRRSYHDSDLLEKNVEFEDYDVTESPGFDLADASEMASNLTEEIEQQRIVVAERKKKADATSNQVRVTKASNDAIDARSAAGGGLEGAG